MLEVVRRAGGRPDHLLEVHSQGRADATFIASMVHYGTYTIRGIKEFLDERGVKVRKTW